MEKVRIATKQGVGCPNHPERAIILKLDTVRIRECDNKPVYDFAIREARESNDAKKTRDSNFVVFGWRGGQGVVQISHECLPNGGGDRTYDSATRLAELRASHYRRELG